jgi:hypothetical protein
MRPPLHAKSPAKNCNDFGGLHLWQTCVSEYGVFGAQGRVVLTEILKSSLEFIEAYSCLLQNAFECAAIDSPVHGTTQPRLPRRRIM